MTSIARVGVTMAVVAAVTGCAAVTVEAPAGTPVTLATGATPAQKTKSFKTWYMLWGLMPLGETSTAQHIKEAGFTVVRVETRANLDDLLMSALGFTGLIPFSRTVVIYGE